MRPKSDLRNPERSWTAAEALTVGAITSVELGTRCLRLVTSGMVQMTDDAMILAQVASYRVLMARTEFEGPIVRLGRSVGLALAAAISSGPSAQFVGRGRCLGRTSAGSASGRRTEWPLGSRTCGNPSTTTPNALLSNARARAIGLLGRARRRGLKRYGGASLTALVLVARCRRRRPAALMCSTTPRPPPRPRMLLRGRPNMHSMSLMLRLSSI